MAHNSAGRSEDSMLNTFESTPALNKHKFESFSQRVLKLKIDPIRKASAHSTNLGSQDSTTHFRNDLLKWKDLNLSNIFTKFVHVVEGRSESLPQILFHQNFIVQNLVQYLQLGDVESLEPLFSLTAQLAHDLGYRFEKHFPTLLSEICKILSRHHPIEVIEWGFSCIAWLFKYLSRLLVPDLRVTFDAIAPLLGKDNKKRHIARFAAEAFSFVIRKATSKKQTARDPLETIVSHILEDLNSFADSSAKNHLYLEGIMTLFAQSLVGPGNSFYINSTRLYDCLIGNSKTSYSSQAVIGITTSLLHHADDKSFEPFLSVVSRRIQDFDSNLTCQEFLLYSDILFVSAATQKGTKISDWEVILSCVRKLTSRLNAGGDLHHRGETLALVKAIAAIFQAAPIDLVLPNLRITTEKLSNSGNAQDFVLFCMIFAELRRERFDRLFSAAFYEHLFTHWIENESFFLKSLIDLHIAATDTSSGPTADIRNSPLPWQERILSKFRHWSGEQESIYLYHGYQSIMRHLGLEQPLLRHIIVEIEKQRDAMLGKAFSCPLSAETRFVYGAGMRMSLEGMEPNSAARQWAKVSDSRQLLSMPLYLENLIYLYRKSSESLRQESRANLDQIIDNLSSNLSSPSKDLRISSIQLLEEIHMQVYGSRSEILSLMFRIENIYPEFSNTRSLSVHIRQLVVEFSSIPLRPWLSRAGCRFCFGVLTYNLSPIWEDAIDAISQMSRSPDGEEIIMDLAFQWLESPLADPPGKHSWKLRNKKKTWSSFQCLNAMSIEEKLKIRADQANHSSTQLKERFEAAHHIADLLPPNARFQAVKVLSAVPWQAERRSRRLVPILLSWTASELHSDKTPAIDQEIVDSEDTDHGSKKAPKRDIKALLEVFAQFTNPKALYRSGDVYQSLLDLLTNSDSSVQAATLKAIFSWKTSSILPYKENLINLADDTRFRDELATFIHTDTEQRVLQPEHHLDAMPIIVRLLYGRTISNAGIGSGSMIRSAKKSAALDALLRFQDDDVISDFIYIALGPLRRLEFCEMAGHFKKQSLPSKMTSRQVLGTIKAIKDILQSVGSRAVILSETLMKAILYCFAWAENNLPASTGDIGILREPTQHAAYKTVRQTAIQSIGVLYQHVPSSMLDPYVQLLFKLIGPRLKMLAKESTQSVSALLKLFAIWAKSKETALILADSNFRPLEGIVDCLGETAVTEAVKLFVIKEILLPLIALIDTPKEFIAEVPFIHVLQPNTEAILRNTGVLLREKLSKDLLASVIELLSQVSNLVGSSSQIKALLELVSLILEKPSRSVNPKVRGNLLTIVRNFAYTLSLPNDEHTFFKIFQTISCLFIFFKDRDNRQKLCKTLEILSSKKSDLHISSVICANLNSFDPHTIDKPDFEKRHSAFKTLTESSSLTLSSIQWLPIIYNLLHFIREGEEMSLRSSASFVICSFVKACSGRGFSGTKELHSMSSLLASTVLPRIRAGALESDETIRAESLSIMAEIVRSHPTWTEVNDMHPLLVGNDEEASFFTNVLHIQRHRRIRALKRLAALGGSQLNTENITKFFVPLLEHFFFVKTENDGDLNLATEAVATLGSLAPGLEWPQLRAILRKYLNKMQNRTDSGKAIPRLIETLVGCLSHEAQPLHSRSVSKHGDNDNEATRPQQNKLAATLPSEEKLTEDVTQNIMPPLLSYLRVEDEDIISTRMAMAVSYVQMLNMVPKAGLVELLPPLLTEVCHILRSRSQETRDTVRKALANISSNLGPEFFGFILKELRTSLQKGYQLHVLSYTVHSLLVSVSTEFPFGELSYCLPQISEIVMEDVFGDVGKEKDSVNYVSTMKEVKSSKSFDSAELIATTTSVDRIGFLIRPIEDILDGNASMKHLRKTDELLRRIGIGLSRNKKINNQDTFRVCYEIIQRANWLGQTLDKEGGKAFPGLRTKGIDTSTQHKASTHSYKLVRFALDLLRSVVQRDLSLRTPANLSGLMPAVGDALLDQHDEVSTSALRFLASILRARVPQVERNASIYFSEAARVVGRAASTNTELAQAGLKLISAVLKNVPSATPREKDIALLLKKLVPDLDEPSRQGATFNFIRSILTRKVVIPEVYEVMDMVAAIMVTSQGQDARDAARSVYYQFLVHYPQSRTRFRQQLQFLVKNLEYRHVGGRQSILEAMHLVIAKTADEIAQDAVGFFFPPLVLVLANDDSEACRKMASALIVKIYQRSNEENAEQVMNAIRSWMSHAPTLVTKRISFQIFQQLLDNDPSSLSDEIPTVLSCIQQVMTQFKKKDDVHYWELLFSIFQVIERLCCNFPKELFGKQTLQLWPMLQRFIPFPHAWVRSAVLRLLGYYFEHFADSMHGPDRSSLPIVGPGGLELGVQDLLTMTQNSLEALADSIATEEHLDLLVKNLAYLVRFLCLADDVADTRSLNSADSKLVDKSVEMVFERISSIIKAEVNMKKSKPLAAKAAALKLSALLCAHLPPNALLPYLQTIMSPLQYLNDPTIGAPVSIEEDFKTSYGELASSAQEIQDLLQKKSGTATYIEVLQKIQAGLKERREKRRTKRLFDAVSRPEKTERLKRRKILRTKEKRRERGKENRSKRRGW